MFLMNRVNNRLTLLKSTAEVYRIGLLYGIFSIIDVVAWADKVIEAEQKPLYEIVEISLSRNCKSIKVASLLERVPGSINVEFVVNGLLFLFWDLANQNREYFMVHSSLYKLIKYYDILSNDVEKRLWELIRDFYPDGDELDYTSLMEGFQRFLDGYTSYRSFLSSMAE
jgi:hypothetical protein